MTDHRQEDTAPSEAARRQSWALAAYAQALEALIHFKTFDDLMQSVCDATVGKGRYALALVGFAEGGPGRPVRIVASAGQAKGYAEDLKVSWSESGPNGRGPTGRAIRSRQPVILEDMRNADSFGPWKARAETFGLRSSVTVPFDRPDQSPGVFIVYADEPNAFGDDELSVFQRLASELSFALSVDAGRARLREAEAARRQAEASLSAALRRYEMLADNLVDIIVQVNRDGTIQYVSPSIRQIGYSDASLLGTAALDLVHPDDRARVSGRYDDISQRPSDSLPERRDARIRTAAGDYVWFEGNPKTLRNAEGKAVGFVSLMRDVTRRRAMEEELRAKRREAEAAAEAKSEFLANMSHEIRTPLTGIIGFAGLLEGVAGLPADAQRFVGRIVSAGNALMAMVNDVLDFAKIEAGQIDLDPHAFDPGQLAHECAELLSPSARGKALSITVTLAQDLPARVFADPGRIRQILLNLLSNALKFTLAGSVTIEVGHRGGPPELLEFRVVDTGIGVPEEVASRLFQRFSQVDAAVNRQFGGTGLGLALSKGLVELMGGEIGFESQAGVGSTFWFTVPAARLDGPHQAQAADRGGDRSRGKRVLVVDDVASNRELLSTILAAVGHEVVVADGGRAAVREALAGPFDIILMDLQMPEVDGFAAADAIRRGDGANRLTPIVAVSANALPEHVTRCMSVGMNDHLAKPVNPGALVRTVQEWTET